MGAVRSIPRQVANRWGSTHWRQGRTLKTFVRKGGYLGGNISIDGDRLNFEVHRFVCEAFHGSQPSPDLEVRHLNGDRLDNRQGNLCWGTKEENAQDILRHGHNHEASKTECPAGHLYDESNTYRSPSAPRKRRCRACDIERDVRRGPHMSTVAA
jgi:hypothetical protein